MKHFSSSTVSRTIAARFGLTAAIATATGALNLAPVALVAPDDRRAVDRRITRGGNNLETWGLRPFLHAMKARIICSVSFALVLLATGFSPLPILAETQPAMDAIRKAAEQGHADAQYRLGRMYYFGKGVTKDYAEAATWVRKAAEQGLADAQFGLGRMYYFGEGVTKDYAEAATWVRKAAEQGNAAAQYNLGAMYYTGEGVKKDYAEAATWFRKAAEQGNAAAQFRLGFMYYFGEGVTKDYAEAAKWYRKAAEQGQAVAQFSLGRRYYHGEGVTKDYAEAAKWYRKAAEQGLAVAQSFLGDMYSTGQGVIKNEVDGLAWWYLAKSNGYDSDVADRDIQQAEKKLGTQGALLAQHRARELERKKSGGGRRETPPAAADPGAADEQPSGNGTGLFVSKDGLVLTAAHVIEGARTIRVRTAEGLLLPARVARVDKANDVALLRCEGGGRFPALPVANSSRVRAGQAVFTIGFPQIELQGAAPKFTKGDISSPSGFRDDPRQWQISVPLQPGNSGGPLFDGDGNVVGIVLSVLGIKAAAKTGHLPQTVNYALKSAYFRALLEENGVEMTTATTRPGAPRMEDMVAQAQKSVVMVLTYGDAD